MRTLLSQAIGGMLCLGLLASPMVSSAQSAYPNKPIRLVIAFPAGGSTDIVGRIVAQRLGERLGQSIIVENRGGAGGTIGTDVVARAAPDGYTLTLGTTSTLAVAPGVYSRLPYDPIKNFAPISLVAATPYLLVVNPQVPVKTLAELVALVKSQPGKFNYASAGNGSTTQLAMEMLNDATGMSLVHIPYKGNADADLALLSNQVQILFGSMPALLQNAKSNKITALAVGSSKRSPSLPNVPTVAELGYPGFEATLWLGLLAPAGTPKPIIDRLNKELVAIAATEDFKAAMEKNGADATSNSPEAFAQLIQSETGKYGSIVKRLGIKLD